MFRKKTPNNLCCMGLEGLLMKAGEAGLGVVVTRQWHEITLDIQARGIAYANEHRIADDPDSRDWIWKISESTGLTYCPACGRRVARTIARSRAFFESLLERHAAYADGRPET